MKGPPTRPLPAVMDEVAEHHEPVLITKNGKPVAELRAHTGRLELPHATRNWRADLIAAGLIEFPVDGEIAVLAAELDALHGDLADRFIAATAIVRGATLLTADERLLAWKHRVKRQDARK